MNISGQVVKTSQLPKKTLGLGDSLLALINSPLETVTVPVSEFVTFVSNQIALGTYTLDSVTTAGNTTTNVINVGGVNSPYLQLNTVSPGSQAVGRFVWNDTDGTVDLRLKGNNVTLQLGQETVVRVVNKTGADLLESQYKVVRVRIASEGGAQGQRLAVVLAQGNNDPDSVTTLGIVTEDIGNNQEGFITVFGNVSGINTTGSLQGETWADGDVLFLSPTTPGSLTKVKPVAPNHTVVMGYVVYAHNNQGKIFVKVDNGYELEELHDVLPTPYVNNGVLYRDTTANLWRSATISTLLGGTPLLTVPTLSQVTTAGNTTTNAITVGGLVVDTNTLVVDSVNNRVGIGTASPAYNLQILDTTSGAPQQLDIRNTTSAARAAFTLTNDLGNSFYMQIAGSSYVASSVRNIPAIASQGITVPAFMIATNWESSTGGSTEIRFVTGGYNNTPTMTITAGSTGNVLIGTTTNAGYKLDVNGTLRINSSIFGQGTTNTYYQIANSDYHHRFFTRTDVGAALERFTIEGGAVSGKAYFQNTNVGIGTTTPSSLFTVNGTSVIREIISIENTSNNTPNYTSIWSFSNNKMSGFIGPSSLGSGGLAHHGYTATGDNSTNPLGFTGITGGTSPTVTSLLFRGGKSNGVTGVNPLASNEIVAQFRNWTTDLVTILGNGNVGIGTISPSSPLHVASSVTAVSTIARGVFFNQTLTASANNDVLVGLDIQPTFTAGAFTGVQPISLRIPNQGRIGTSGSSAYNIYLASGETTLNSPITAGLIGFQLGTTFVGRFMPTTGNLILQNGGTFTDAGYKLDVVGTGRFSGGANQGAIFGSGQIVNLASDAYMLATSTTGKNAGYTANRFSTSEYASFDLLTGASMATGWSMQMTPGNTALQFVDRVNSATRLALLAGGNVGIGTTNPLTKLHILGTSDVSNGVLRIMSDSLTDAAFFTFGRISTTDLIIGSAGTPSNLMIGTAQGDAIVRSSSGKLHLGVGYSNPSMTFMSGGNIGINTLTNAGYRLEVVGTTKISATFGSELAPALTSGNWTTSGGMVVSGSIAYTTGTVATATPVTAITPVVGQWYKVTYTVTGGYSANSVFSFGGTVYSLQLGTNTVYLNAVSTSAFQVLALATTNPSFTITALSIVQQTSGTGTLTVDGAVTMNNTLAISSVGIGTGTATPTAPLQVVDVNSNGIRVTRNGVPSQYIAIHEGGGAVHTIETVGEKPFRLNNTATTGFGLEFYTQNTARGQFSSGGNFLIGTTSDAGFKLDVNGTARIQGIFYASNPTLSGYIADFGGTTNGMVFQNAGGVNRTQLKGFSSGIETIRLDVLSGAMFGSGTFETSAQVTINSTSKGFLPPRMTTAQILLISSPAEGLQVYNTDLKTICFYNGTAWQRVTSTAM